MTPKKRDAVFQPEFIEDLRYWVETDRKLALRRSLRRLVGGDHCQEKREFVFVEFVHRLVGDAIAPSCRQVQVRSAGRDDGVAIVGETHRRRERACDGEGEADGDSCNSWHGVFLLLPV